jgi:hypothetical protein
MFSAKTPPVVEYLYGNEKNEISLGTKHRQGKTPVKKSACKSDTAMPDGLQHDKIGVQNMQVTGLNHGDDVKKIAWKENCMALAEPQLFPSHAISYMDPSTTGHGMTQIKLNIVVFHVSIDNSELPRSNGIARHAAQMHTSLSKNS